jgi:diadenosine tetraphosphatase ApaH/serine/threonine PP2A family protein phosphatase
MLALLFDIHGNLPALDAVLDDARAAGARRFLLGGDYAVFGGWPAETVDRLRHLDDATWIRGNVDRWAAGVGEVPDGEPMNSGVAACRRLVDAALIAELGALPESADLGDGTRAWHASPKTDLASFWPEPADDELDLLEGVTDRRLVFGHFHVAFERIGAHEIDLMAPGSVGIPLDGDHRAAWALMHDDGRIERRRVAYDHRASAARVREVAGGAPWGEVVAGRIERAGLQ